MRLDLPHASAVADRRRPSVRRALGVLGLVAAAAFARTSAAAEVELLGTGTFKPPTPERLTNVPADLPFSRADLASGTWSFATRYEDRTADSDPDPYVGRYVGAIRSFRMTVGAVTVDLPVDRAEIIVSDGGLGFPERESIQIQVSSKTPYGVIRVSWTQIHQTTSRTDLRGASGLLASDALPAPSMVANLPSDRPFDRFLLLRVDSPTQVRPLLYLSSSSLSVSSRPVGAP